jgi:hypothetical protein
MPLSELQSKLQRADLQTISVWCDRYEDWKCAADVPELKPRPRRPPPLPSPPSGEGDVPLPPEEKRKGAWRRIGERTLAIAAGLISFGLAKTLGGVFWLPTLLISITWFILRKCKVSEAIVPMVAILIGHTVWMLIGFTWLYSLKGMTGSILYFSVDLIAVAGLSIWTLARRSIPSAVGILVYQLAAVAYLATGADEQHIGPIAISMHALLRALGIAAAIYAIVAIKRLRRQKVTEVF